MPVYAYEIVSETRTTEGWDVYENQPVPVQIAVDGFRIYKRDDMERDVALCDDRDDAERIVAALNAMEQRV